MAGLRGLSQQQAVDVCPYLGPLPQRLRCATTPVPVMSTMWEHCRLHVPLPPHLCVQQQTQKETTNQCIISSTGQRTDSCHKNLISKGALPPTPRTWRQATTATQMGRWKRGPTYLQLQHSRHNALPPGPGPPLLLLLLLACLHQPFQPGRHQAHCRSSAPPPAAAQPPCSAMSTTAANWYACCGADPHVPFSPCRDQAPLCQTGAHSECGTAPLSGTLHRLPPSSHRMQQAPLLLPPCTPTTHLSFLVQARVYTPFMVTEGLPSAGCLLPCETLPPQQHNSCPCCRCNTTVTTTSAHCRHRRHCHPHHSNPPTHSSLHTPPSQASALLVHLTHTTSLPPATSTPAALSAAAVALAAAASRAACAAAAAAAPSLL